MDDARAVGGGEGIGDLGAVVDDLGDAEAAAGDDIGESAAGDHFHDHDFGAIVGEDVVDGDDVGVIEGGGGLGFLHEAAAAVGIAGVIGAEDFEGDDAIELEVFGFIDLAYAAGANFLQDLILASNRGLHCFQSIAWVGLGSLA